MSEKIKLTFDDQLLKEALQMEIDTLEVPQPERVWRQIEAKLERSRRTSFGLTNQWSRLAAVAAAFLILFFGGIGLFRTVQFGAAPAADSILPAEPLQEVAVMEAVDEQEEMMLAEGAHVEEMPQEEVDGRGGGIEQAALPAEEEKDGEVVFSAAFEEAEEQWPSLLPEGFRLYNTIILEDETGDLYLAGLYRSETVELMWVKTEQPLASSDQFIETLEGLIGAELQVNEEIDGLVSLTLYDMPGLAWPYGDRYQALIVTSGSLEHDELKLISTELP